MSNGTAGGDANRRAGLASLFRRQEAGIFLALLALMTGISLVQPQFASGENLYLVSRQIALTSIVALGVFFVILTGGIDLSVGSTVALGGMATGLALAAGWPPVLAVAAGLLAGALVGAVNAAVIAYVGVTPFIVTLAMLSVGRGAVLVTTRGEAVRNIPESFIQFGTRDVLGVPMVVVVLVIVAAAAHVILTRTVFGRRVYAVGGNEEATALSGIDTRRIKFAVYILAGLLSSVTGVLYVARFRSAQAAPCPGIELDAIAAAVIGGTSLMGGRGTVAGVLIGATLMGVIRNGLVVMGAATYWQEVIIGGIIALAAVLDVVRNRGSRR